MGGAESFCCAGRGWWRCGGCWARAAPLPGGCHSLAECGVFIYYLWRVELSQDMEGAGGQCWCWWDTEAATKVPPSTCWLCLCPKGGHGCGRWQRERGRGWMGLVALGPRACPLRGHRGGQGSVSAGEHPTLSPGFPSSPCTAVQPFGSGSPSPGHWGWGERGGGSWGPPGPSWRRTFTFTAI